jgi:phage/plasmid-like protein (TIGR03299 family)
MNELTLKVTDEEVVNLLEAHGLNFTVGKIATPNPFGDESTGNFTSYRTDTKKIFAQGLSSKWQPIQNIDAFKCLTQLSTETGIKINKGFTFGGGAEICFQLDLGDFKVGNGDDTVKKYVTVMNSHNGTRSMSVFLTPLRLFCMNQINAMRTMAKTNSIANIQHTTNSVGKLEQLIRCMDVANREFDRTQELYNSMANTKINEAYVKDILTKLFPLEGDSQRSKSIWTNKMNDMQSRFYSADKGRIERDTAWNLYNSVQGHIQHYGNGNPETRLKSVLVGSRASESAECMTAILEMTSSEYTPTSVSSEIDEMIG